MNIVNNPRNEVSDYNTMMSSNQDYFQGNVAPEGYYTNWEGGNSQVTNIVHNDGYTRNQPNLMREGIPLNLQHINMTSSNQIHQIHPSNVGMVHPAKTILDQLSREEQFHMMKSYCEQKFQDPLEKAKVEEMVKRAKFNNSYQ